MRIFRLHQTKTLMKKKLDLRKFEVKSFITEDKQKDIKGGWTGNCLSFIRITCPDPDCDFKSVPLDECEGPEDTFHVPVCSGNCTDPSLGCQPEIR